MKSFRFSTLLWLLVAALAVLGAGGFWLAQHSAEHDGGLLVNLVGAGVVVTIGLLAMLLVNRSLRRQIRDRTAELRTELTERRKANDELARSEQHFRDVFDSIREGIFLHDCNTGKIVQVNQCLCDMYGCTAEQALQTSFAHSASGQSPYTAADAKYWMQKARDDGPQEFEWHARRVDDGALFWVAYSLRQIVSGDREYVLGVVRDISMQKRGESMISEMLHEKDAILQNALVGIVMLRNRTITTCNRKLEEIFGYTPGNMIGLNTEALYATREAYDDVGVRAYDIVGRGENFAEEVMLRRANGDPFWGALTGRAVNPERPHDGSIWIYSDISERKQAEQGLQLMASVFSGSNEAIMISDAENRIVAVNRAFAELTGYAEQDVIGLNPKILSAGKTPHEVFVGMWDSLNRTGAWQGELWDRRKNGEPYPKWLSISVVRDAEGKLTHYIGSFVDITERKASEEQVRHLAHHDALTGLPNRFSMHERLDQAISFVRRGDKRLALMLVDLDHFKSINDTLGHDVGDQLLIEVAARLSGAVRDSDTVARLGGDEFVVVLPGIEDAADAAHVADKMLAAVSAPYLIKGNELRTSPSVGICIFPDDATEIGDLLKKADVAMYHAKSHGRRNYQFFANEMQEEATRRMMLEKDLRVALEANQFLLHYQPQLDLRTGTIVGVEALVRWQHPERGMVSPLDFIPIAEETGLIAPLGDWILCEACRQLAKWREHGLRTIRMSVNLSASQFADGGLGERINGLLTASNISPANFDLEITESMSMGSPLEAIENMKSLRGHGMSLSIDDFGTGYSSLAYLKLFPIQTLKIDRSFVKDIETDVNDADICDVTVLLAHKLGMTVVAEGVETEAQLKYLLSIGCEKIQGYFISKPLPGDKAEQFIRDFQPIDALGSVDLWAAA